MTLRNKKDTKAINAARERKYNLSQELDSKANILLTPPLRSLSRVNQSQSSLSTAIIAEPNNSLRQAGVSYCEIAASKEKLTPRNVEDHPFTTLLSMYSLDDQMDFLASQFGITEVDLSMRLIVFSIIPIAIMLAAKKSIEYYSGSSDSDCTVAMPLTQVYGCTSISQDPISDTIHPLRSDVDPVSRLASFMLNPK